MLFAQICHESGVPAGVVNIINGAGETGASLAVHNGVDKVAFTGSTAVGRAIRLATAGQGKKLTLELGGKSAFIVFEDADIESAVNVQVSGVFAATGQSCVAGSRLNISNKIKDVFLARLVEKAENVMIGAPDDMATEMGPLCT